MAERPFRLYIAKNPIDKEEEKGYERWRCYSIEDHAHTAAWIICKRKPVGSVLEVQHIDTNKVSGGQYKRHFDKRYGDLVSFIPYEDTYEQPGKRKPAAKRKPKARAAKAKRKAPRGQADKETGEIRATRH